jgi:hypothetical protein
LYTAYAGIVPFPESNDGGSKWGMLFALNTAEATRTVRANSAETQVMGRKDRGRAMAFRTTGAGKRTGR